MVDLFFGTYDFLFALQQTIFYNLLYDDFHIYMAPQKYIL